MKNWLIKRLKQTIARPELEALYRYRMACDLVRRWNGDVTESFATGAWIHQVGEAERGFDIEDFREQLLLARDPKRSDPCPF